MQMNTFHRYDADVQDAGVCLDPTLAMANHSCLPNAMIHFMGRYAVLIALQTINVGEEVEISYIGNTAIAFK
jgi:hypothetical protein